MPHDFNNQVVQVGDRVYIPCIVQSVQPGDDYCNVNLVTEYPMLPTDNKSTIVLNTRQVVLQAKDVGAENLKEAEEQQAREEAEKSKPMDPKKADKLNRDPNK